MNNELSSLFAFFKLAERLKTELRHSWTTDSSRQESVAEHTWMVLLFKKTASDIFQLWEEYELKESPEAKFAYALDKFECLFQHDLADIETWDEADYRYTFIDKQDRPFDFDRFVRTLKDELDDWTYQKVEKAGFVSSIPKKNLKRYLSRVCQEG